MNIKPVCSACQMAMRPHRNGVLVVETYNKPPLPYKLWGADEWKCPVCGHKVIVGFSEKAIHAPYTTDVAGVVRRIREAIAEGRFRAWKEREDDVVDPEGILGRYEYRMMRR
jgi:hypothetical protein